MLHVHRILVSAIVLASSAAALVGCGQRGPLYLPTEAAAAQRATLPQVVKSQLPGTSPTPAVVAPALPTATTNTTAPSVSPAAP